MAQSMRQAQSLESSRHFFSAEHANVPLLKFVNDSSEGACSSV
jgi:hypothetical protein